ncbi:OmpA family protein [Pararhodobacter oceanensis]|uniref:OmpA family protein n=1 Tax=Pararhodobacter oceanensis TaxID=2172121 RepID=UPI003A903D81
MNSASLRSTTAMLVALSMMQPLPALAQSAAAKERATAAAGFKQDTPRSNDEVCAESGIIDALACELHIQQLPFAGDALTGEAETEAEVEVEDQAEVEVQTDTTDEIGGDFAGDTGADAAAEAGAEAEAAVDAATDSVPSVDDLAGELSAADTAGEAEVSAETEAEAEPEAAAAESGAFVEADADIAAEAQTEATDEPSAEAQVEAEAEAEVEAQTETQAESEVEAQSEVSENAVAEAPADAAAPLDLGGDCADVTQSGDALIDCAGTLSEGAREALAAGSEVDTDASADVTVETVTETTSRSSGEEFREWTPEDGAAAGSADGQTGDAQTSADAQSSGSSGLSDLERAGLFTLGALAVGAILSSGQRVDANTGDRVVVVDEEGEYQLLKDDDALLRQPGSEVRTERYADGTTRTVVTRPSGTRVITVRNPAGRALRRVHIEPNGREYVIFDDTQAVEPVDVSTLPAPTYERFDYRESTDRESLRLALQAADERVAGRGFSLNQIREIKEVRDLAPEITLDSITFATGSAAIRASQAEQLREIGVLMRDIIRENPTEVFLIEGHTDAVGDAGYNLLLSDRRAESAALALSEYFNVPAENMVVQGYGERYLRIRTQQAEEQNRRVAVRRITGLLRGQR